MTRGVPIWPDMKNLAIKWREWQHCALLDCCWMYKPAAAVAGLRMTEFRVNSVHLVLLHCRCREQDWALRWRQQAGFLPMVTELKLLVRSRGQLETLGLRSFNDLKFVMFCHFDYYANDKIWQIWVDLWWEALWVRREQLGPALQCRLKTLHPVQ